ncbi:MAG: hypothetical protein KBC78_00060 [Candidatus Pacebacteria bacterium]|nr:hypothetical protein [Candidatus Paceibacterota bacterium]
MPNKELVDYINSSLSAGESPEKIRVNLITSGWKEEEIDDVLNKLVSIFDANNPIVDFDFEIKHEVGHEVNSQNYPNQNQKKDLSPLYYLLGALILDVVGFGVCAMGPSAYISLFTIIYLSAAVLAFISIIKINQVDQITGLKRNILLRIIITILALAVGGWGLLWGVWGIGGAL